MKGGALDALPICDRQEHERPAFHGSRVTLGRRRGTLDP